MLLLSSTNPQFSYLIRKNPDTDRLYTTNYRKGVIEGWYPEGEGQSYKVALRDFHNQTSLKKDDEQFSYTDISRYAHPYLISALCSNAFKSAYTIGEYIEENGDTIKDGVHKQSASFLINMQSKSALAKVLNSLGFDNIDIQEKSKNIFKILLTEKTTLKLFLKKLILASTILTFKSKQTPFYTNGSAGEDIFDKVVNLCNDLATPYYVRKIVAIHLLQSKSKYNKKIQQLNTDSIRIGFGNSQQLRYQFILDNLDPSPRECPTQKHKVLLDIGCGEGFNSLKVSEFYDDILCVDTNPEALKILSRRAENRGVTNIETFDNTGDEVFSLLGFYKEVDILCTEVLEHMALDNALQLVHSIISKVKSEYTGKLLITLPNKNFNKNYLLEGFRHDDHVWEASRELVDSFTKIIRDKHNLPVTIHNVGDVVSGEPSTFGLVIEY